MKVNFTKRASDAVRNLQPKQARQIAAKIATLRVNPHPQDCKKLHGTDFLRVDSGEYRIVYGLSTELDPKTGKVEPTLNIDAVGKRNDDEVYRGIKKK